MHARSDAGRRHRHNILVDTSGGSGSSSFSEDRIFANIVLAARINARRRGHRRRSSKPCRSTGDRIRHHASAGRAVFGLRDPEPIEMEGPIRCRKRSSIGFLQVERAGAWRGRHGRDHGAHDRETAGARGTNRRSRDRASMLGLDPQVQDRRTNHALALTLFARRIRTPTKRRPRETVRAYGASPRAAQGSSWRKALALVAACYHAAAKTCAGGCSRAEPSADSQLPRRNGAGDRASIVERVLAAAARVSAMLSAEKRDI